MRNRPSLRVLPFLFAASLAASLGACADGAPPKMVSIANQTSAAHRVQVGAIDFASVAPGTMSDYREVSDGDLAILVDDQLVWRDSLGSDNVGGSWTVYVQSAGGHLSVGVSSDD